MDSSSGRTKQIGITIAVLVAIALIVVGATALNTQEPTESAGTSDSSQTASDTSLADDAQSTDTASSGTYQNGEYTKTVRYSSPGGMESITFTVTLENNVITATSAEAGATNREAREYQEDFIDAYESSVIGKSIDEISVNRIAGASLTTGGFRDALEQIQDEARA